MLSYQVRGTGDVTLFLLPFLGGSGHEWVDVVHNLGSGFRSVVIDLPGFGDSADIPGYSVEQMSEAVTEVIRSFAPVSWLLVGHSMGAKVAAVIARCAEDGDSHLAGLRGLILMAGSPPSPEPMEESRRTEMLSWFQGSEAENRRQAEQYIASNANHDLDQTITKVLVSDVLRTNPAAWQAWLSSGSREDWSARIGTLNTPTVLVAGELDKDLGPAGQRRLMLPHFAHAYLKVIPNARHLLPVEQPAGMARIITQHAQHTTMSSPTIDPAYLDLIHSDRVSEPTRKALLARAEPDDTAYQPRALSLEHLATLRALLHLVIPQRPDATIDLAARIDQQLAAAKGDGWRYAKLPGDIEAYRRGLETLDHHAHAGNRMPFANLLAGVQTDLVERAAAGTLDSSDPALLDSGQLKLWFEDLRGDAVRHYVAHPATLARMGYSGIADGADTATMQGFTQIGVGQVEPWEPLAIPEPKQ